MNNTQLTKLFLTYHDDKGISENIRTNEKDVPNERKETFHNN